MLQKWIFRLTQAWRRSHRGWWRTASPWRRRSQRSPSWRRSSPRSYNKVSEILIEMAMFMNGQYPLDRSVTTKASFPTRLQTKCLLRFWMPLAPWFKCTVHLVKVLCWLAPMWSLTFQYIWCNFCIWYKYGVYLCAPDAFGAPGANIWEACLRLWWSAIVSSSFLAFAFP